MTRPAIDPDNIRRQSTPYKVTRTIARGAFWVTVTLATTVLFIGIASIDSLIP